MKELKQKINSFVTKTQCDKEELLDLLKEVWYDAYGCGGIDANNLRYPSKQELQSMFFYTEKEQLEEQLREMENMLVLWDRPN